MGATAQFKKVLSKGPMPLNGKVLDDYDEEDDLYEDEDMDENSPVVKYSQQREGALFESAKK